MIDIGYYEDSVEHRNVHKCGGYPYAHGQFLNDIVRRIKPKMILEIGTAIGFSAYCLALKNQATIYTIDMVEEHHKIANTYWTKYGVSDQITPLSGNSKDVLPKLDLKFDIIFFDGFAPDPLEVEQYIRLINNSGVIISTNLSWNETTPKYLQQFDLNKFFTFRADDTAFSSAERHVAKSAYDLYSQTYAATSV